MSTPKQIQTRRTPLSRLEREAHEQLKRDLANLDLVYGRKAADRALAKWNEEVKLINREIRRSERR